jgi:hypothetical protein
MDLSLDTLRALAALAGIELTDAELASLRPGVERTLGALADLERLPLADVEPSVQYRVL